ncbi:MAG TPA: hypothetical protein VJ872_09350 [Nocardioides sp.]|nr:hypothetical protein [Nocardioides sp.]
MYDASPEALRPLFQTYWSSTGWRQPAQVPDPASLEAAIDAGIMFREPATMDHDGWVGRARAAAARTSATDVGAAFLSSLESRRLDLRSALGSYAIARHLPAHEFTPTNDGHRCRVCGLHPTDQQDLNILSFERFKWGGVRRDDVAYLAFDLDQFAGAPRVPATEAGLAAGREIATTLRSAAPSETATKVAARLRSFASNKAERETVVDILGVCGVLRNPAHPGYRQSFVSWEDRPLPDNHHVERAYPTCWWRGSDGIDDAALEEFLPQLAG